MGLDMYLSSVPKVKSIDELDQLEDRINKSNSPEGAVDDIRNELNLIWPIPIEFGNYDKKWSLRMDCLYWRKFNALHSWFVTNVQNGIDECQPHIVTTEQLKALQSQIEGVTKQNVKKVFPTLGGFFFGGTEYDEYFWEDLELLKSELKAVIGGNRITEKSFVYRSSW